MEARGSTTENFKEKDDSNQKILRKKKNKRRGSTVKVDLIDFQSNPDKDYRWVMIAQDQSTKFIHLYPLKTDEIEEVAKTLLDIFLTFGPPTALQSKHGEEFVDGVITSLKLAWPEIKILQRMPHHSHSQESVEDVTKDVLEMLSSWQLTNKSTRWADGLKFIACEKNATMHPSIGRSPYEAVFGCPMKMGLATAFPGIVLPEMRTEEELQEFLERMHFEG